MEKKEESAAPTGPPDGSQGEPLAGSPGEHQGAGGQAQIDPDSDSDSGDISIMDENEIIDQMLAEQRAKQLDKDVQTDKVSAKDLSAQTVLSIQPQELVHGVGAGFEPGAPGGSGSAGTTGAPVSQAPKPVGWRRITISSSSEEDKEPDNSDWKRMGRAPQWKKSCTRQAVESDEEDEEYQRDLALAMAQSKSIQVSGGDPGAGPSAGQQSSSVTTGDGRTVEKQERLVVTISGSGQSSVAEQGVASSVASSEGTAQGDTPGPRTGPGPEGRSETMLKRRDRRRRKVQRLQAALLAEQQKNQQQAQTAVPGGNQQQQMEVDVPEPVQGEQGGGTQGAFWFPGSPSHRASAHWWNEPTSSQFDAYQQWASGGQEW